MRGVNSMSNEYDRNEFAERLKHRFPEALIEIRPLDDDDLINWGVSDFARVTHNAMVRGDFDIAAAHFKFIGELFDRANQDLWNDICISYLEDIFLERRGDMRTGERYLKARALLPNNLEQALVDLQNYLQ